MDQKQRSSLHYHRPFEKTGFVPLPEKQKKKPLKSSMIINKKPQLDEVRQIFDPTCEDCYDDCYEQKLSEILLYKLTNRCSLRVETIQSIKVRQHEEYNIAKNCQNFSIFICQNGTYHLKQSNHKVLMVREAFRLVAKVHGQFHLDGELMRSIIKTQYPWVSFYYINQFVLEFPLVCPYCRQFPALEASQMPTPKSRMWFYLEPTRVDYEDDGQNQILTYSRPSAYFPYCISPNIQPIQVMLQELKQLKKHYSSNILDPYHCQPDTCEHDEYEAQYLICLFVFKQNQYPLIKTNNHIGRLIHAIRAKIKQFEVRVCNQGTDHLWHKQKNMRILMKDQINAVVQILHNGNVPDSEATSEQGKGYFHRNQKLMRFMLQKQLGLYPYNIIAAMRPFLNKCPSCSRKKIYLEYKREQIVFEETEMVNFRLKLHDARKRYKATKQIPKVLSYDQMILKSQQLKADSAKIPTVVNGQIIDPNDSHPNDQEYSAQVKAMLQKYVDHPEMFQFFSNDAIWLIQFNQKTYPESIADQNIWIRKYAYDGMYRMVMITTQSMRQSYLVYGQCLCVDFIPMMIKRRSPSGRHFQIGFLTGMDSQNKTVLFGVCFMSQDLMIYHRKMFEFFFEMVGQIIPGTIITSSGKNLSQAVYLMKKQDPSRYRFNHYIGWFYVIEDLKKDLSGEYDRSQMLKQFCNLLVEANPITHQKRLIEITSQIVERTILQKFLKSKNKYCLSCLSAAFMGYALQTKRVQDLYDHLTETFIYQSRIAQFMFYIFKLEDKLNNKKITIDPIKNLQIVSQALATQIKVADNVVLPEVSSQIMLQLVWISEHIGENILRNFMKNFIESRRIILLQEEDTIQRGDHCQAFFLDTDHLKYSVRYSAEDECWRCSCPWIYWTGIPCCHLIKMITKMGGNLRYYISQRWILDAQNALEQDVQNSVNEDIQDSDVSSEYGQQPLSKIQPKREPSKQQKEFISSPSQSQQSQQSSKQQKSRGRKSLKQRDSARPNQRGKNTRKTGKRVLKQEERNSEDSINSELQNMSI